MRLRALVVGCDQMLNGLERFLIRYRRTANKFVKQAMCDRVRVYVDTEDHAGCALTRRSTFRPSTVLDDIVPNIKSIFSRRLLSEVKNPNCMVL